MWGLTNERTSLNGYLCIVGNSSSTFPGLVNRINGKEYFRMNKIERLQEMGLTEMQIVELFGKVKTAKFMEWMAGQTVGLIDGIEIHYYCDVRRFFCGGGALR